MKVRHNVITTVVFDLDDTLYDEIDYCRSGFETVSKVIADLAEMSTCRQAFEALWRQFTLGNHTKTFNAALNELGIACDDELIKKLVKTYRQHKPVIKLPDESRDILDKLTEKYRLALLTDGFLPAQQLKVQALGIEKYFECIIYTEQLGRQFWKPSPAGFQKIMQNLDVQAENCVYIADNEAKDFIAPNKLGFQTVQLIRPNRIHTQICEQPNGKAGHKIKSLKQLSDLLVVL